jgi:hypothetical protein
MPDPEDHDSMFVSSKDTDAMYRFTQQLSSCQFPIANKTRCEKDREGVLAHKLRLLAEKGQTFALAFYKGGQDNCNSVTIIVCEQCGARLDLPHAGTMMLHVTLAASYVTPFVTRYIETIGITQV